MNGQIFTLGVPSNLGGYNVWAFDLFEEYTTARAYLQAMNWPHIQYHSLATDGTAKPLTAWKLSDSKWVELSQGVNDAEELKRHIEEQTR
jgi:hypothetical protein